MKLLLLALLATFAFAAQSQYALGETIYKTTCISCHGIDGNSQNDMKLVVKPRILSKSILTETQAYKIIKYGAHAYGSHADIMPTFKYVYSDIQIKAVAHYVSKTFNSHRDKRVENLLKESAQLEEKDRQEMMKVGKKIFQRKCGKCHGVSGNGESDYVEQSKSNQNFIYPYNLQKILLSEKQIFLYAKFGGKFWGTAKNDMPSWKKRYNDIQLKSVAHYVATQIKKNNKQKK
ncbi:c-type cytochrome [Sulfurimonas sp.]|uniref:c-type cytochrome n=1 Tax=Sulfurimonas sp. TaxID=2022749 RepID=UPI00260B56F0|nr:c-type cytochrome [Sulfurimonas sp.]